MSNPKEHKKRFVDRLKKSSLESFYDYEVLELLLTYSMRKKDVRPVAKSLLARFKGLRGVFDAGAEDLRGVEGVGESTAVLIGLVKGAAEQYLKERFIGGDVIRNPDDVVKYLKLTLSGSRVERFLAIYLNARNEAIAVETLHVGTVNATVVYPRKVIELAFKHGARSVIFVHNHPSGNTTPSDPDRHLMMVLDRAAIAVDMIVHDHMIIGRDRFFSARESGWVFGTHAFIRHAADN